MYVSVQLIILEILLGLLFLAALYLMLRELLKKHIREELQPIKESLEIWAKYLMQSSGAHEVTILAPGQKVTTVTAEASPEKIPVEPVDVADEFVALKTANRINAYNLQVQKIWELYKHKKINIKQYNEELVRLKKEYGIDGDESGAAGPTPGKITRHQQQGASLKPEAPVSKEVPEEEKPAAAKQLPDAE